MYVKYKKTITDQLMDARMEALFAEREIEFVVLTHEEWGQLRREAADYATYAHLCFNDEITISGMRVIREQM